MDAEKFIKRMGGKKVDMEEYTKLSRAERIRWQIEHKTVVNGIWKAGNRYYDVLTHEGRLAFQVAKGRGERVTAVFSAVHDLGGLPSISEEEFKQMVEIYDKLGVRFDQIVHPPA